MPDTQASPPAELPFRVSRGTQLPGEVALPRYEARGRTSNREGPDAYDAYDADLQTQRQEVRQSCGLPDLPARPGGEPAFPPLREQVLPLICRYELSATVRWDHDRPPFAFLTTAAYTSLNTAQSVHVG